MTTPKFTTFWPEYQPTGHGIHICKFSPVTSVTSQSDDTPASTIPTSVFYSPPSQLHSSIPHRILSLCPALLSNLPLHPFLRLKPPFGTGSDPKKHSSHLSPASKHLHLLLRLLRSLPAPLVQVPSASWKWLLSHFPPDKASTFPIMHDRFFLIPVYIFFQLYHQYQIIHIQNRCTSRISQFSSLPSLTWQKCSFAAPKIAKHSKVIRSASDDICSTTAQLDTALRATRPFWSDFFPPSLPSLDLSFASVCSCLIQCGLTRSNDFAKSDSSTARSSCEQLRKS